MIRLQKYLAGAGIASRRKCEEYIQKGMVMVDGKIITQLGTQVDPEVQEVFFKGRLVKPQGQKTYIMLNKPPYCVSTCKDDKGRDTVLKYIRDVNKRLYPVGRLDYVSEGLLLMTDDGEITNKLLHPKNEVYKTYFTVIEGVLEQAEIEQLKRGLVLDGQKLAPCKVALLRVSQGKSELKISIREGKNRQIRRMMEVLGKKVVFLKRTSIGKLFLGNLKRGTYRYLTQEEIAYLKSL